MPQSISIPKWLANHPNCKSNTCYVEIECHQLDRRCPAEELFLVPIKQLVSYQTIVNVLEIKALDDPQVFQIRLRATHAVALFVQCICLNVIGHFSTNGVAIRPNSDTIVLFYAQEDNIAADSIQLRLRWLQQASDSDKTT